MTETASIIPPKDVEKIIGVKTAQYRALRNAVLDSEEFGERTIPPDLCKLIHIYEED